MATKTRLSSEMIERLIDTFYSDDSAILAVRNCGDDDLIAAVREAKEGAGADASPMDIYRTILMRIADERSED